MIDLPFTISVTDPTFIPSRYDRHIERRVSSMKGQYLDTQAYNDQLLRSDLLLYEVYEINRPQIAGELLSGISIVHPGKIGNEFYMTKGHFHQVLETAEIYYCLNGEGCMVMEDPEGNTKVELLAPGKILYVPPRWAHRSVCTGKQEDLITFFVYPGNAGHDYGTIEVQGFHKLVIDGPTGMEIIDNPNWKV
jgi:glucose-6-phosphate isomerase, archaeal